MKLLDSAGVTTLWNKIKTYVSGNFLALNGGTMQDYARIGGKNLYLGDPDNGGYLHVLDICSQEDMDNWYIDTAGIAKFEEVVSGVFSGPATKLTTSMAGSATTPCYFTGGKPSACTYSLNKTVPADAVFTDTHYTASNVVAESALSTSNVTAVTQNPYLNLVENGSVRSSVGIVGRDGITVSTTANGNIIYIDGTPFYKSYYINNHTANQYEIVFEGGDGSDADSLTLPQASDTKCGLMKAEDKLKVNHLDFNTEVNIESRINNETDVTVTCKKIMQLDDLFSLYYIKLTDCNPTYCYGVIGSVNPDFHKVVFPAAELVNSQWVTATTIVLADDSNGGPDIMTIDILWK